MKFKVGITGTIGSGKSTVAAVFAALGVPIYDSDSRAKILMSSSLCGEIAAIAGSDIFDAKTGELNRKLLAIRIFANADLKSRIEALVHPAVVADFVRWSEQQPFPYTMIESALLFSSPYMAHVAGKTIAVTCDRELAIERSVKRDKVSVQMVEERIACQIDAAELEKKADFVVHTNEKELLVPQILKLHNIFINFASI